MPERLPIEPTDIEIPLSDPELVELGRFSAVIGQIDHLLIEVIALMNKTPFRDQSVFEKSTTTGARLATFRKLIPDNVEDKDARSLAEEVVTQLSEVVEKRNHIVHGIWVRQIVTPQKTVKPASYFGKHDDEPIFADELRKHANAGAKVTRLLGDLIRLISPLKSTPWEKPSRLTVTDQNLGVIPDWLAEKVPELAGPGALIRKDHLAPGDPAELPLRRDK